MKIKFTLVALLTLATSSIMAQFSLSGEFRPRTEYFGNGGNFTVEPGTLPSTTAVEGQEGFISTSARVAIKATYKAETYTLFTSLQEVFLFGDRQQISAIGNGNLRIQEAWADIKLAEFTSLKVGRQPISYDDQRILGGLGWAQQARTHDAAILKYLNNGYSLDLGGALNTNASTGPVYNNSTLFTYRDMGLLRANKKYGKLNISALALVNTYQDGIVVGNPKASLFTGGVHTGYKTGGLNLTTNIYFQDGQRLAPTTGAVLDVKGAYLASLLAKYKFSDKFTLGAGYESISGRTDDSAAFFPIYGTNHKFNGLMDRFYVGNHGNSSGLNDLQVSVATKISGIAVSLTGHYFTEVQDVASAPGTNTGAVGLSGKDLGSELDLVLAKKFKEFSLAGGYSQFFEPSGVIGKNTQNWAWLMLTIKPSFLQ